MSCSIDGCGSRVFCRGWCSKHYSRWHRRGDPLAPSRLDRPGGADEKWCPRCAQLKHVRYFGQRKNGQRKGYCRECYSSYLEERLAASKEARVAKRSAARKYASSERNRELRLAKLYGITLADYDAMVEAQDDRCAICSTDKPGGSSTNWHVDHDHSTGRVRGLLCSRCNLAIGQFNDDPALLIRACVYLGAVPTEQALAFYKRSA
jgi:hypothetical protein